MTFKVVVEDQKNWLALQRVPRCSGENTFSSRQLVIEPPFQFFIILANSFRFGLRPMFKMKINDFEGNECDDIDE